MPLLLAVLLKEEQEYPLQKHTVEPMRQNLHTQELEGRGEKPFSPYNPICCLLHVCFSRIAIVTP
jgi:hypothetical protein